MSGKRRIECFGDVGCGYRCYGYAACGSNVYIGAVSEIHTV
jgi:hypothetical protein